jgi:hypothetical protein
MVVDSEDASTSRRWRRVASAMRLLSADVGATAMAGATERSWLSAVGLR